MKKIEAAFTNSYFLGAMSVSYAGLAIIWNHGLSYSIVLSFVAGVLGYTAAFQSCLRRYKRLVEAQRDMLEKQQEWLEEATAKIGSSMVDRLLNANLQLHPYDDHRRSLPTKH